MTENIPAVCACGPLHARQDGYRVIDSARNLWGCGTCGRPTRAYVERVARARVTEDGSGG